MSVADGLYLFGLKRNRLILVSWIENQIVVSQGMVFGKFHVGLTARLRGAVCATLSIRMVRITSGLAFVLPDLRNRGSMLECVHES